MIEPFGPSGCPITRALRGGTGWGWGSGGSFREQLVHTLRHLRALRQPVFDALPLEFDAGGISARIIGPDHFHRASIAGASLFDHHNTVMRLFARTNARQSNH